MAKIIIVRHGQDEDNAAGILNGRRDKPLTLKGERQAIEVAVKLQDHGIKRIFSSPLQRASQTANIIAKRLNLPGFTSLDVLIERDFGILTGKPITDIPIYSAKNLRGDRVLYFLEVEGAETFPVLLERGASALERVQTECPEENSCIVAHGDIGKMIQAAYHGWTWEEALNTSYFENTGVLTLNPQEDIIE
jgi:broad specificity phosphatase PhoE